jgi:hypothetical protein
MLRLLSVRIALAALTICCLMGVTTAQNYQSSEPIIIGNDHESAKAALDLVAQTVNDGHLIILIGRLGDREYSRRLNRQRLEIAGDYLTATRGVSRERIIRAEGERVRGDGRLEVYLNGKLFMIFKFPRNQKFTREG